MHLLQLLDRDLGINLSGRQVHMPQDQLDVADIGAVLQHMGGHAPPEQLTGA